MVFPHFTTILSTAVVVIILSLRPLALVYKLLLSNVHSFLCQLESRLANRFTLLQASLDNHLDTLVKDLEEKARNRNPEPSKNIAQLLPISHSLPQIPPLQHQPSLTPREDSNVIGARPPLQREFHRNPPAASAEFDNEGWLLVCDPELGVPLPADLNRMPHPSHRGNHLLFWTKDKVGTRQAHQIENVLTSLQNVVKATVDVL